MATMAATMVGTAVGVARVAAVMVAGVAVVEAGKGRDAWRIIPRSKWLMTKVIGLVH